VPRTTFTNPPFHSERPWVLRPVRVDPKGVEGPTPKQARGPRARRTSCGLYVVTSEAPSPEQRAVDAWSGLVLDGWVTGWAALRWWGGYWFDGVGADGVTELAVPLVTSIDQTPPPGSRIVRDQLSPRDRLLHEGLPVTTPVRSLFHEVIRARVLRDAVIAIDLAAYNDLVSLAEFELCLARHRGWRGIRQARAALGLASENSLSPREPGLRLALRASGILSLEVNATVFSAAGKHLGTPDLLDAEAGVVIEYDGAVHLEAGRRRRDRDREEAFRRVGLEYATVLAGDGEQGAVRRVLEARKRARSAPPEERSWTLEAPHWWVRTETVAQRRALPAELRAVWLNLRRRPEAPSALGSPF
jgi:hypothetical protein